MTDKKNDLVSLVRITATLLIVLCHLCTYFGLISFGLVFNVGIQMFLFLSGWLYGRRNVFNGGWLKKRWIRVTFPVIVWASIWTIMFSVVLGTVKYLPGLVVNILNLQGLTSTIGWIKTAQVPAPGTSHLWFVTSIWICYLMIPIIQKSKQSLKRSGKISLLVLTFVAISCLNYVQIHLGFLFIFCLGYFVAEQKIKIDREKYLIVTVLCFMALGLRLLSRWLVDGTTLYNYVIVDAEQDIFAIWIIATVVFLAVRFKWIRSIATNRVGGAVDNCSYEIYIVHWIFLNELSYLLLGNAVSQILLFTVFSTASALFLHKFCNSIRNYVGNKATGIKA